MLKSNQIISKINKLYGNVFNKKLNWLNFFFTYKLNQKFVKLSLQTNNKKSG